MKLTSLKREGKEFDCCSPCCGPDMAFPWGLSIHLDADTCEKLGLSKQLAAGTKVSIQAMALVTSSSESLGHEGKEVCMSLQITDMAAKPGGVDANAADTLYPKS